VDHGGVNAAVMRSRNKVWIIQGAKLAKTIISKCYECKLRYKPLQGQKMAPFHSSRIGPTPIFSSVAVDLFGPLEFRDMVKKRVTGKGWGVIFVCTATTAIHIELTESYSTDSFLQALRRFVCMRGAPARIYSDRGTQLVQAAKEVAQWDFSAIQSWCSERKFTWELVPTGGQHMNGLAERMIGIVKKTLVSTLKNRPCSFNELNTVLCEVALIINSRPIGITGRGSDLEAGGPITPLHLMLGRATAEAPRVVAGGFTPLNSRLQYVEEIRREFWNKFRAIVFQGLDRSYRWRREFRDLCTGDVVLLKDETAASASYKIARITRVFNSQADGKVHRIIVKYKNPGEAVFRMSERPVQKVVLVVPIEDQNGGVGDELARPLPTTGVDMVGPFPVVGRPGVDVARPLPEEVGVGDELARPLPTTGVDAVGLLPVVGRGKEVIGSPPREGGRPGVKVARPPPEEVGRGKEVARPPPWESDTGTRAVRPPLVWPGGGAVRPPPGQEYPANQGQVVENTSPGQEEGQGPLAEDPPRAVSAAERPAAVPPDLSRELAPSSRVGSDLSEPQESQGWAGRLRVPRDRKRPQRYQDPDLYKY
jgi:transposase InsO family protein